MYLPYVYLVTNKITNEFYYGSRYHNIKQKRTPEEDFWVYYFTSSKKIKALIELYGTDSFEIKIIMKDLDYDKCYFYEQELIAKFLGTPLCLNGHCTKTGKFSTAGNIPTAETRSKISISSSKLVHSAEAKIKMSNAKKGLPRSAETKAKLSKAHLGKLRGTPSDDHKHKIRIANTGNIHSNESKLKMSNAKNGYIPVIVACPYCDKTGGENIMHRWHFDKCKYRN